MDTSSSSSMNMVESPSKHQRSTPALAAAATLAAMRMVVEHEVPISVRSSTSSGGTSIVSSAERNRRTALTRARREAARLQLALVADEQVAEAELEEARPASASGSLARLEDVASDGGASARAARPRSNAELAIPPLLLGSLQEHQQPAPRCQDGERSPANAGSGGQGTTNILIQQTINNDGCFQGPLNVNVHQEVYHAAEQVAQVAEERHKAAVINLTAPSRRKPSLIDGAISGRSQ